jgi:periplasmic protein TonB
MDFARQQRDPTRHMIGIGFVILVHVLVIYALLTGLGSRVIEVMKKPLTAKIIEEIKPPPPPPPPPKKLIEPPKIKEIQPFVPPPDIPVPQPPTAPVIAAVVTTPPTEPNVIAAPVQAPVAKPAVRQGVSCKSMDKPTFPREAIRAGVEKGRVVAILSIDEKGNVTDVAISSAQPPRVFDRVVHDTLSEWKCVADGTNYKASVEINFSLQD